MKLTKIPVVVLVLIARTCRTAIVIGSSSSDESTAELVKDLGDILSSCYGDRINAVGLAGDLPDALSRTLMTQHLIPVAYGDNTKRPADSTHHAPIQFRRQLRVFIVGASSQRQFGTAIQGHIKRTIWWNNKSSFLIVDRSPKCAEVLNYLFLAWRYDLINAVCLCPDAKNGKFIVNYNPFANQAPVPWKKVKFSIGSKDYPFFSYFIRKYERNASTCLNQDFDKTKDIWGCKILVGSPSSEWNFNGSKYKNAYQHEATNDGIFGTVYNALNVTYKTFAIDTNTTQMKVKVDILRFRRWIQNSWKVKARTAYPHAQSGFVIVSQFRGHKSQFSKIFSVIDIYSLFGMAVVYLITLIFLKFFAHQALVTALLNLVRITCNRRFTNIPNNISRRIFLMGFLFFVVAMQGIYQGNLTALVTQKIPLRNVNTLQDLVDLGYKKIYGPKGFKDIVKYKVLKKRCIVEDNLTQLFEHVVHDSSTALIYKGSVRVLDEARRFKLHVSTELVEPMYEAFQIRWSWPLEQRFNEILAKLVEADIREPWDVKCNPVPLNEFEEVKKNTDFEKIELDELTFSFVILGIGLVCATIVFIVELAIHSYISRTINVRVQILSLLGEDQCVTRRTSDERRPSMDQGF